MNVIDGVLSPAGAIFVMTTNHIEKLDPALIRPGRVDLKMHITYADRDQKRELYKRFFPEKECLSKHLENKMTMADLQQILMEEKVRQ